MVSLFFMVFLMRNAFSFSPSSWSLCYRIHTSKCSQLLLPISDRTTFVFSFTIHWESLFFSLPSLVSEFNIFFLVYCFYTCNILNLLLVRFSCSVMSDSLWPHELQHARPPCPSPTPRVYSNPCPSSRWCHPAISSSVVPFSSSPRSLPASGPFPITHCKNSY